MIVTHKKRRKVTNLEAIFAYQLRVIGMPVPEREYRFHPVRQWRLDFAWPALMVAVEVEGGTSIRGRHVRPEGFREDCCKYNELALLGWKLLRGDSQMVKNGTLLEMVERAIKPVATAAKTGGVEMPKVEGEITVELSRMTALLNTLREDAMKFDGGNGAAGPRVRSGMLELRNWAQNVRNKVTAIKNK